MTATTPAWKRSSRFRTEHVLVNVSFEKYQKEKKREKEMKNLSLEQGHGISLIKASRGTFDSIVTEVLDRHRSASCASYCSFFEIFKMAASYSTTIVLVLSFVTTNVLSQTFQYSHGWTNGKRTLTDVNSRFSYPPASSWTKNLLDSQFDDLQSPSTLSSPTATATTMTTTTHCNIQKMRLFFQGNNNEALYLVPCETSALRKNLPIIVNGGDGGGSGSSGSGGSDTGGSSIGDSDGGGSDGRGCWIENTSKRRLFRSVVCRPSFVLRHDGERRTRKPAPSTFDFWVAKLHE
ncbi:pro-corazonin [Vespula squamosa]|uniref:Pro-corazonin n=1 Tax=Vespula squamosa TaxID=30214 RepID=A0ABD2B1U5_VESSQ